MEGILLHRVRDDIIPRMYGKNLIEKIPLFSEHWVTKPAVQMESLCRFLECAYDQRLLFMQSFTACSVRTVLHFVQEKMSACLDGNAEQECFPIRRMWRLIALYYSHQFNDFE